MKRTTCNSVRNTQKWKHICTLRRWLVSTLVCIPDVLPTDFCSALTWEERSLHQIHKAYSKTTRSDACDEDIVDSLIIIWIQVFMEVAKSDSTCKQRYSFNNHLWSIHPTWMFIAGVKRACVLHKIWGSIPNSPLESILWPLANTTPVPLVQRYYLSRPNAHPISTGQIHHTDSCMHCQSPAAPLQIARPQPQTTATARTLQHTGAGHLESMLQDRTQPKPYYFILKVQCVILGGDLLTEMRHKKHHYVFRGV